MHFGQSHSLNHLPRKPRKAKFSNYRIRETGCCDNCNICKGNMDTHLLGVVDMYRMQVANKNGGSQRHIGRSKTSVLSVWFKIFTKNRTTDFEVCNCGHSPYRGWGTRIGKRGLKSRKKGVKVCWLRDYINMSGRYKDL